MLSLFRKKKADIRSVSIPDFGWKKIIDDKSIIQWVSPDQSIAVSINFFELPPDIPTMKDIQMLRDSYRRAISNVNGGLVEVELLKKNKIAFIKTIFKIPKEPSGMTYVASLTLPFKNCSFVLKVYATETGMTGVREAIIADRLTSINDMSADENGYLNWLFDPYDGSFKNGTLMNKSEQYCYDIEFLTHPLTLARQLLQQIEDNFQWASELETTPAFDK